MTDHNPNSSQLYLRSPADTGNLATVNIVESVPLPNQKNPQQSAPMPQQHKEQQEEERQRHLLYQQQQQQQIYNQHYLLQQREYLANGYQPYYPGSFGQAYLVANSQQIPPPYLYPPQGISNAYNSVRNPVSEPTQLEKSVTYDASGSHRSNLLDGGSDISSKRRLEDGITANDEAYLEDQSRSNTTEEGSPEDFDHRSNDSGNYGSAKVRPKKTRKRLSVSCRTCRQKKIKCDRQRPICGSCSKNNLPTHLCIYDDSPWVSSLVQEQNLYSEIENLKDQHKKLLLSLQKEEARAESIGKDYNSAVTKLTGNIPLLLKGISSELDSFDESPIHIRRLKNSKIELTNLSITMSSTRSTKTFGPLSWQNIQLQGEFSRSLWKIFKPIAETYKEEHKEVLTKKRSLTTHLFESKSLFPFSNVDGKKMDPDLEPSKSDSTGRKLQEVASVLPSFKYLERKVRYYFDMHYSKLFDPFFDDKVIFDDFKRIFKKTRKGGVDINVYDPTRDHQIELAKLAQLFLLIKFGIVFDENNGEFDDSINILIPSGVSCIFVSNCLVKPSIAAVNALIFIAVLKLLNPDDWGDDIIPEKSPFDMPMILDMAYNMMMLMGFWKSYDEIDDIFKNVDDPNENYVTELHLKGLWKNLLYIDSVTASESGSSLALRGFTRYKSLSTEDICVRQTVFTRFYYGKYSYLNGYNQGSIGKVFHNIFDYSQQQMRLTRLDIEKDLYDVSEYFENYLKMGATFWNEYYHRTYETSPAKDRRLLFTLQLLDLTSSLSHLLYFSYLNPDHDFNGSNPAVTESDREIISNLEQQFLNNTLLHAIYLLKLVDWSISQELTNEAVSKNKILQITSRPRFKKTIMKAISIVLVIFGERSKLDEFGMYINSTDIPVDFKSVSLFSLKLHELEELCFKTNVCNKNQHYYYNVDFFSQFCAFFEDLYRKIRVNDLFIQDTRWFALFQEYYHLISYFLNNKRVYMNDGKNGAEDYTTKKVEILKMDEYNKIKIELENKFDSEKDKDFMAVSVGSILN